MKNISNALLELFRTQTEFRRYDLIRIQLPNDQFIYATNCPTPVTFEGNQYHASKFGIWERGAVTSQVAETPKAGTMSLTVAVPDEVLLPQLVYPGTLMPLFQAANLGLFDAAEVWVWSFWQLPDESAQAAINNRGVMVIFGGVIAAPDRSSRSKFVFKCTDMLYLLNVQFPVNIVQSSCPWTLYDSRCKLNKATFATTNAVGAGSGQTNINCATVPTITVGPTTFSGATGSYTQGRIKFTSGQNAGFTYFIKVNTFAAGVATIVLSRPMPLPVEVGDTFIIYPGCAKTQIACNQFVNIDNFRGFPYVPNPEVAT